MSPSISRYLFCSLLPLLFAVLAGAQAKPGQYPSGTPINFVRTWTATSPTTDPATLVGRPMSGVKQSTVYIDGLGRPLQTVVMGGSVITGSIAVASDLVIPVEYDAYGREVHKWLPYPSPGYDGKFKTNAFGEQATALQAQYANVGSDRFFYGQTDLEASPLNRPTKTFAPGNNWVGGNHGIAQNYWLNTATDSVQVWNVTDNNTPGQFGTYASAGAYAAGQLYKNATTDENGKQVETFTDKEGHAILKKVQFTAVADDGTGSGHSGWLCTYYIYDDLGNLRCVIQPAGVQQLSTVNYQPSTALLAEQCFRYEYDARQRMTTKQVPGAGAVYMVYDARDRLVMVQDANMRLPSFGGIGGGAAWMVTVYDNLDRPTQTGLLTDATSFATHLSNAYTSTAYPSSVGDKLTETHYDDYANLPTALSASFNTAWNGNFGGNANSFPYPQTPAQNTTTTTKGMATWTSTKVLGTQDYLAAATIYDNHGRPIQAQSQNISGGTDVATTQYNWLGQPMATVQKQQKAGGVGTGNNHGNHNVLRFHQ